MLFKSLFKLTDPLLPERQAFEKILLFFVLSWSPLTINIKETLPGIRNFPSWVFWTQRAGPVDSSPLSMPHPHVHRRPSWDHEQNLCLALGASLWEGESKLRAF